MSDKQVTGRLENWYVHELDDGESCVFGDVFEDSKDRFLDGTFIRTSLVESGDFREGGRVQTCNSFYALGKQHPDWMED